MKKLADHLKAYLPLPSFLGGIKKPPGAETKKNPIADYFSRVFSIDLRALALFRIMLGVLLVIDVLLRWTDIRAFYTNFGLLPIGPYVSQFANSFHISLHLANGSLGWQVFLFSIMLISSLALLVGYRSRFAALICWVLLVSVQNRNPIILNGGDVLLRLVLFWGLFLPLGARYSIDRALSLTPLSKPPRLLSGATIGLTLQIPFIYTTTALLKTGREWWPDGTASYYALSLDTFVTSFGTWMSQHTELLRLSTYAVLALEMFGPLLFFAPVFFVPFRLFAIAAFTILHINFDLTMRLGLFPWVDIALLAAMLPGETFDWLYRKLNKGRAEAVRIYYDGDCGFCKRIALLLRTALLLPDNCVQMAQDDERALEAMRSNNSWVVATSDGKQTIRWDAFVTVLEHSPLTSALARRLPLRRISRLGDLAYNFVASRRNSLGPILARSLPYRDMRDATHASTLNNLVALFFVGYIGLWNLKTIPRFGITMLPEWERIGVVLRLDQKWNMFAPYPLKEDGWFVIDGSLIDGTNLDVMTGQEGPVSYEKPAHVAWTFKNARWRKYMMNIYQKRRRAHRLYFGKYLCRSFNEHRSYEKKLSRFELVFMKERTPPPGGHSDPQRVSLWRHDCFKKSASHNAHIDEHKHYSKL